MTTGYEVHMYHDISSISRYLEEIAGNTNRIANCLEAAEKRVRAQEDKIKNTHEGSKPNGSQDILCTCGWSTDYTQSDSLMKQWLEHLGFDWNKLGIPGA